MAKLTVAWPFGYDDFAAPATATTWTLNDSAPVSLGATFAAAPTPWTETYWTPAEIAFNAAGAPPAGSPTRLRMLTGVGL